MRECVTIEGRFFFHFFIYAYIGLQRDRYEIWCYALYFVKGVFFLGIIYVCV